MVVVAHEAPGMKIDNAFPFNIWMSDIHNFLERICNVAGRFSVVKFEKVVHETSAVAVVHEYVSLFGTSVEYMVKLHHPSLAYYGCPTSIISDKIGRASCRERV